MSNDLYEYYSLLSDIINQEITFLKSTGHIGEHSGKPCIFCSEVPPRFHEHPPYDCDRFHYLCGIKKKIKTHKRHLSASKRLKIGYMANESEPGNQS